jgi:hypothetical protein
VIFPGWPDVGSGTAAEAARALVEHLSRVKAELKRLGAPYAPSAVVGVVEFALNSTPAKAEEIFEELLAAGPAPGLVPYSGPLLPRVVNALWTASLASLRDTDPYPMLEPRPGGVPAFTGKTEELAWPR